MHKNIQQARRALGHPHRTDLDLIARSGRTAIACSPKSTTSSRASVLDPDGLRPPQHASEPN
eukprot:8818571-Pyramimonas_sp.AAC.1